MMKKVNVKDEKALEQLYLEEIFSLVYKVDNLPQSVIDSILISFYKRAGYSAILGKEIGEQLYFLSVLNKAREVMK